MKKKRRLNKNFLYGLIGIAFGVTSIVQASNTEHITHTVKPNENLWSICKAYYDEKNLSADMEFTDFIHQVERENDWLRSVNYRLQPNDVIKISHKKIPHASTQSEGN